MNEKEKITINTNGLQDEELVDSIISEFSSGAWIADHLFNEWIKGKGFKVTVGKFHNRFDGEVNYFFNKGDYEYELRANRWSKDTYRSCVRWLLLYQLI